MRRNCDEELSLHFIEVFNQSATSLKTTDICHQPEILIAAKSTATGVCPAVRQ